MYFPYVNTLLVKLASSKFVSRFQNLRNMSADVAKFTNRLSEEKSPYLLQHAHNPVDWYPWRKEAFEKAKAEDKLIFLSVGYSTCHWCHVMEKESFESEKIADVMNKHYVNVKVDREERPDIDEIYMSFIQASTGGGGWPMSVWLTPELKPIFGGTYFPPEGSFYGRPGFKDILETIAQQWKSRRSELVKSSEEVIAVLSKQTLKKKNSMEIPEGSSLMTCFKQLSQKYDPEFGGYGQAPKFPQPSNLIFMFLTHAREPNTDHGKLALSMNLNTLSMMAKGGIHDHVSLGFARYSTDDRWHVPHFEKMLYDQGQLAVTYTKAFLASKDKKFVNIINDILSYTNRDLSHNSGAFYSAEDADSYPEESSTEKKEGAFCVWTSEEIKDLLKIKVPDRDNLLYSDVFCYHFNVKDGGNVNPRSDPHGELKNKNVLIIEGSGKKTMERFILEEEELEKILKESVEKLYAVRVKRPRPHLDNKILTSWNSLAMSGFALAGAALMKDLYVERASKAAEFLQSKLYKSGILLHSCYVEDDKIDQVSQPIEGFLDDYAFLIQALLDLYEASYEVKWIEWAYQLQQKQDELFWDSEGWGYFTSSSRDENVVMRIKDDQDGAEPSPNSVSALNLLRLSAFLNKPEYKDQV